MSEVDRLPQNHFPLPEEKVILLDLDQTCIDADYELIDRDRFCDSVRSIQDVGWEIGISSDTPLKVIKDWAAEWGFTGPHIAEKGSVVEVDGLAYYDRTKSKAFVEAKQKAKAYFMNSGAEVWSGDPVRFIRSGETIGKPGDEVVLINDFRLCSLGIFVRRVAADGTLYIDEALTNDVISETRELYPRLENLNEEIAPDHGLLILSEKSTEKRKGTIWLKKIKSLSRIAMIGDSMADYLGSDIALHYAVGNASEGFKKVADYTAEESLSNGVVEILDKLQKASVTGAKVIDKTSLQFKK